MNIHKKFEKSLPKSILHYKEDTDGPPWLRVEHKKFQLEYPDGSISEEFLHDVVVRKNPDAVVIVAYDFSDKTRAKLWLRSCVRPAIATRGSFPNTMGNIWELPAGLIEKNEDPKDAAVRELREEVGFDITKDNIVELGRPLYGCIGFSCEVLHFLAADVTNKKRKEPLEDGSPLERYGKCILATIDQAIQVGDLKTEVGANRLYTISARNIIKNVQKMYGNFKDS